MRASPLTWEVPPECIVKISVSEAWQLDEKVEPKRSRHAIVCDPLLVECVAMKQGDNSRAVVMLPKAQEVREKPSCSAVSVGARGPVGGIKAGSKGKVLNGHATRSCVISC